MDIELPRNGDGFVLRLFTREDASLLADIEFDSEVKKFLAIPNKGKAQWIKDFDPPVFNGWAVEVEGRLAGRAYVEKTRKLEDKTIEIVIGRPYWGKKLGRRVATLLVQIAFTEYKAKAIWADVHPDNCPSIALLKAFKFKRAGTVRGESAHWQTGHFRYRLTLE